MSQLWTVYSPENTRVYYSLRRDLAEHVAEFFGEGYEVRELAEGDVLE